MSEEVYTPEIKGTNTIVASVESDATRTHLDANHHFQWNKGDGIGVFDASGDDDTNAYFGFDGSEGKDEFTGDLMSVKGKEFFAYYPYSDGKQIQSNVITFEIPAKQKFNHVDAESPASGTVPSVAMASIEGDKTPLTRVDMHFYPVVAYVAVPIYGVGNAENVTLQINVNGEPAVLSGEVSVNLDKEADPFYTVNSVVGENTILTMNCGEGTSITDDKKYFVFAIPAGIAKKEDKLEFIVSVNDEELEPYEIASSPLDVVCNSYLRLSKADFEWIEGTTGSYVIRTAEQFIEYAYAATKGVNAVTALLGEEAKHDMIDYEKNTLKPAMIVENLTGDNAIDNVSVGDLLSDYEGEDVERGEFEKAVYYYWYKEANNKGIETIGGGAAYSITGNVAGEAAVIEGLNVNGNGIFFTSSEDSKLNPVVKNVKFDGVTITPAEDEKVAYVIADDTYFCGGIEDVEIANVTVEAAEDAVVALYGTAETDRLKEIVARPEDCNYLYANVLKVYSENDAATAGKSTSYDLTKYFDANGVLEFGSVVGQGTQGDIVIVADEDQAKNLIGKIDFESTTGNEHAPKSWFSVMDETTSYWTGFEAPAESRKANWNDEIVTAEELAAYVHNSGHEFTLTHDINLMYKKNWVANCSSREGNVKKFNVDGDNHTITKMYLDKVALFGYNANVKNLTVTSVFVNADAPYVLAKTGTAEKVTLSNVNYQNVTAELVGGLFYEGSMEQVAATTDCSVTVKNVVDDAKFGALYAKVKADLANETNKYTVPAYKGAYDPFAVMTVICSSETVDGLHSGNIYVTFEGTVPTPASAYVDWELKKGEISDGFSVSFLAKGESTTANQAVYDGSAYVDSTEELQNVIGSMLDGEKVTVKLVDGDFSLKAAASSAQFTWPKNAEITFVGNGAENTTLTNFDYTTAEGTTVVFENLTLSVFGNTTNHTAMGLKGAKAVTLKNVDIVGEFHAFAGDCTFEGCNFYYGGGANNTMTRYGLYIETAGKTTLTNCVFDTACKKNDELETKAILVYSASDGSGYNSITGDIEITGCEFKAGTPTEKAAIEIHSELFKVGKNSTLTISNTTYDAETYKGGLYRELNGNTKETTEFYTVVK